MKQNKNNNQTETKTKAEKYYNAHSYNLSRLSVIKYRKRVTKANEVPNEMNDMIMKTATTTWEAKPLWKSFSECNSYYRRLVGLRQQHQPAGHLTKTNAHNKLGRQMQHHIVATISTNTFKPQQQSKQHTAMH